MSGKVLSFTAKKSIAAPSPDRTYASGLTKSIVQELLAQADSSKNSKKSSAVVYNIFPRVDSICVFIGHRASCVFTPKYAIHLLKASSLPA
ncbi:hypothetical protein [Pseudomonas viridiflava]|uniref:hypothetical protein n=1 Tax=Pseudomonas viridiflava TaxID=33069 RepID=UPI0013CEB8C5|nr:hypothetical protein [Pseudomonas viridiflava]